MHQERTSVRSYNLPASRSSWREQSGRQHALKGIEPKSLSRELQMRDWIAVGLDLQIRGPKFLQTPLKQAFSLKSGTKMGRPEFEDPTPHVRAKSRRSF